MVLKIAPLAEMTKAGFEPALHFSERSKAAEPRGPAPVSMETGTKCPHSNTSMIFPTPPRCLVRIPIW